MANPVLKDQVFREARLQTLPGSPVASDEMTLDGVIQKTGLLFMILIATGFFGWQSVTQVDKNVTLPGFLIPALLAAFVLAIVTSFRPKSARITAPLYAACEGLVLGAISAAYNIQYKGIVMQAILLTAGVFVVMLGMFQSGKLRATPKFKKMVFAATFAIMISYLISMVANMFGANLFYMWDSGPVGILISLVIVTVASLNLIIDFDFIASNVGSGTPKYFEWYSGFALMVTVVWLYLEILRLLSKLRD